MTFYPHNTDFKPPVQPSGGGKAVANAILADLIKYEVAPQNTGTTSLHAAVTLSDAVAKTASTTSFLATAAASDNLLKLTTANTLAIGDLLKDAAQAEVVRVTAIADAPIYTVERGFGGTTKHTHLAGATWDLTGQVVPVTLLATELEACPQLVEIKGVGATLAGDVVVVGEDFAGNALSETIALNAAAAVPSVNAFKSIDYFIVPLRVAASDSVSLGTVKAVGIPWVDAKVVLALLDGSTDAGSVTSNADVSKCVYTISGSPNGTNKLDLFLTL